MENGRVLLRFTIFDMQHLTKYSGSIAHLCESHTSQDMECKMRIDYMDLYAALLARNH